MTIYISGIERDFALAKELHGFRYTQMYGKTRMEMKSALTFACMNLKKAGKMEMEGASFTSVLRAIFFNMHQKPGFR